MNKISVTSQVFCQNFDGSESIKCIQMANVNKVMKCTAEEGQNPPVRYPRMANDESE